jgi:hypothetical protein
MPIKSSIKWWSYRYSMYVRVNKNMNMCNVYVYIGKYSRLKAKNEVQKVTNASGVVLGAIE